MLRLLNIELQKLLLNKLSKTLIIIFFILPFSIILLASSKINAFELDLETLGVFSFPVVWHVTTFIASYFKFIFAIVIVSMIGNEYNNKTLKQNLIDGLSKKEFILSKFYTLFLFSIISTCLIAIITLSIGLPHSNYNTASDIFLQSEFLLAYLVKLIAFFCLCLFFGILIKRSAFAIAFIFILYVIEWILYGIFSLQFSANVANNIKGLLPLESMYNLIKQPFQRIAMSSLNGNINLSYDFGVHWYEITISLGWTIIFLILSYKLLQKRDL